MSDKILKLSQAQTLYEDLRERINALPTDSDIPEVPVQDVQVNGSSILSQGVANVPKMSSNTFGVAKIFSNYGIDIHPDTGNLMIRMPTQDDIKSGIVNYFPITASKQHISVFYALAKAAGADMKDIANTTVGSYPDAQKAAIQNMLGITDLISTEETSTATAAHAVNSLFLMDGKLYRATAAIAIGDAVTVGTNCEVVKADEVFVKKTDKATSTTPGLVRFATNAAYGIWYKNAPEDDVLRIACAGDNEIKAGSSTYMPIVPAGQHKSIFYGLSKLAGIDLANETVTIGTYPSTSKVAIRKMIDALGPSNINAGLILEADADDGSWILSTNVQDVQINGTSIVNNGIANIPKASTSTFGVVKTGGYGVSINNDGVLYVYPAGISAEIKPGTSNYLPIVPSTQHASVYYGLSKLAGVDLASETVTIGTYPTASKTAIRNLIGATSSNVIAVQDEQPTDTDTKIWLPETEDTGIEVPTYTEFQALDAAVVKKTDVASTSSLGIVKVSTNYGTFIQDGILGLSKALTENIKGGTHQCRVIVPYNQHEAVFYGLSKVAGVDLASETVTVGTYPATASAAIRSMLGAVGDVQVNGTSVVSNGVANIPLAGTNTQGCVRIWDGGGIGRWDALGNIYIICADSSTIKAGTHARKAIVPSNQHESVFYGLAKAAGDTTQSASSNEVGTYTTEAKAAIHTMLGIDPASIAAQVDIPLVETVSGTTPTITGQPNVRYVCGEVSTITITPPASGSVDVIFESGSTATTMTVPSTVKWPAWFDAEALEANTTYEVLITDGIYGSVMTWAT